MLCLSISTRYFLHRFEILLRYGGFTIEAMRRHYVGGAALNSLQHLVPLGNTFPMGFSWSSCIAQSYLLTRFVAAGLRKD